MVAVVLELNLPLFPFDSVAITVTTTVWVGVCVAVFFNLRLGWALSGLVVPGYLIPLIMTRPISAGVILVEAIITYLLVLAISELPRRSAYWSSFFGRDRFFAILVVSVLVRALFDGWLLPHFGRIAVEDYGINFDYRNNLHSFGLIVVALIANYFWKPGLRSGVMPLMACVAITYCIIQFGFVGLTNFNVGNFHLLYEDISTSLLASPKSYIIVLITAYIASCFNLRYAWDFNGILVPALLGLLWHDPTKILFSVLEAVMIYFIASYLINSPIFRKLTIQGGRKLCFFFTVCFAYRLILCHVLPNIFPQLELSDTFGFGYLLSTLMAIKAHDKHLTIRLMRSTVEVSMLGAVVGSLIGFAFYCGPNIRFDFSIPQTLAENRQADDSVLVTDQPLCNLIRQDKVLLYEKRKPESYVVPVSHELNTFSAVLNELKNIGSEPAPESLRVIAARLQTINYQLLVVQNRFLYLRENSPANGWGMYVVDTENPDGLCLEIPAPLDEWSTIESGVCLLKHLPSNGLAIAGSPRKINLTECSDVTTSKSTMFAEFHEVFGQSSVLQVRGHTEDAYQLLAGPTDAAANDHLIAKSQLWIRGAIPSQLKLKTLKELVGSYDIAWNSSPIPNRIRQDTRGHFSELILNLRDRRRLIGKLFVDDEFDNDDVQTSEPINTGLVVKVVRQNLREWLADRKSEICLQGTDSYQPAKVEQMLYMDHEVVAPLIEMLGKLPIEDLSGSTELAWLTPEIELEMLPIQASARALGYQLTIIVDPRTNESYLALAASTTDATSGWRPNKGWGTYVFRPGLADSFAVEVPRPLFERRSFDFGISLFERPKGSALLIAGAHPRANLDGSADISKVANKTNLFNLVRHVLLRQIGNRPYLITQARAIQAPVQADIVLATDDGISDLRDLTPLKKRLVNQLNADHLSCAFVDGHQDTAGYELGILMQATSVQVSENKEVISLWLSPSLRIKFRDQADNNALAAHFEACGLPTVQQDLTEYLTRHELMHEPTVDSGVRATPLPDQLKCDLHAYVDSFDILKLINLTRQFDQWNFTRLLDSKSGQAFLLVSKHADEFPTVLNLTGYIGEHAIQLTDVDPKTINAFISSRALWLEPVSSPAKENLAHPKLSFGGVQ